MTVSIMSIVILKISSKSSEVHKCTQIMKWVSIKRMNVASEQSCKECMLSSYKFVQCYIYLLNRSLFYDHPVCSHESL